MVYIPPYVIDYDELGDTVKTGIEKNDGNVRYAYDALNELSAEIQLRPATGQEILNKLLPVDGIGSGLDAEYLGGRIYSEYASSTHTHPLATTTNDGFMSLLDKQKLDSVAQGAEMNVHSDWNEIDFQSDSYIRNKPKVATIDGSPVDGNIAVFTGPLSMRGADKDEMATMLDYFKQTDFISTSAGNEDANKPIVLDPTGLIHASMIPAVPAEAIWGAITGTLSNQADLQAALDLKLNISDHGTLTKIQKIVASVNTVAISYHKVAWDDDPDWIEKCTETSWENETLNTSTRGKTRKFPAECLIVGESTKVTFYDMTDPDVPMWMVFNCSDEKMIQSNAANLAFSNGALMVGGGSSGWGMTIVNFITDSGERLRNNTSSSYYGTFLGNIAQRNEVLPFSRVGYPALVNGHVNDLAVTLLPDQPINPATGQRYPTIFVFTDGGLSVIDGTAGQGAVVDLGTGTKYISGSVEGERTFAIDDAGTVDVWETIPSTDTGAPDLTYSASSTPALLGTVTAVTGNKYFASSSGLTILDENTTTQAEGATSHISSDYPSGMMRGDIKTCLMADTESGSATGTITDRSMAGNDATITGSLTKSPVATGAELMAFGGFSASDYAESDSADYADTQYISAWVKDATLGWQKQEGLISANPVEGVTLTGSILHIEGILEKALVRVSATVPTPEQIKADYLAELPMFQENAKCTLSGSSDDVLALDYDASTDEATVLTDVKDVFSGLINIEQGSFNGTAQCVSVGNGTTSVGTNSEVTLDKPELNIREEFAKIPKRNFIPVQTWFMCDGVIAEFPAEPGYDIWAVYEDGVLQQEGVSYEVTDNGVYKTVTPIVTPVDGATICLMTINGG